MRGIQFLRARRGGAGTAVDIGMVLLGERAIGRADLRVGASPVQAEVGVMVGRGNFQRREVRKNFAGAPRSNARGGVPNFQNGLQE